MPVSAPDVVRSEVTVPLTSFIQPYHSHYFSGQIDRPHFQQRDYSFPGIPELMPLARLFLDTCAADCSDDYRYLFTLLGSELAANAIRHSRSGLPGGFYDFQVRRSVQGMHVTCRDRGSLAPIGIGQFSPDPNGLNPNAEAGRGLAMVDAFATTWGTTVCLRPATSGSSSHGTWTTTPGPSSDLGAPHMREGSGRRGNVS